MRGIGGLGIQFSQRSLVCRACPKFNPQHRQFKVLRWKVI